MTNLFMILEETAGTTCSLGSSSFEIPDTITSITATIYTIVKIGVPLLLIVYGMWDFGKSVMAGKEDEIKANQKLFIKRLVAAAVVFLILAIVQLVLGLVASSDKEGIMTCINGILGNN